MGRKSRDKLARRQVRQDYQRNTPEEEPGRDNAPQIFDDPDSLQCCFVVQTIWLALMMLKLYAEGCGKEPKPPGFWQLVYIWDDYIPIAYILGIAILRYNGVLMNHFYLSAVMFLGFVPPFASSVWYLVQVYYRTMEIGFPVWEDYPFGIVWWICLSVSHILRCRTVHAFVKALSIWVLADMEE